MSSWVQQIPKHGEQVLTNAADHFAVHERAVRRVLELERNAAVLLHDLHAEPLVALEDLAHVVFLGARVQHGQRALPPETVQATLARIAELAHLEA